MSQISKMEPVRKDKDFLVFGAPLISEDEIGEVVDSLRSGWLGTGKKVARFEKEFLQYKNVADGYAAALNSCTAALHVTMESLGLSAGDEVITTPLTFCATVNSIIHAGLKPVLADIDPVTLNIDPNEIESKITDKTKAILVVHFAGYPCEMDKIVNIAAEHNLYVIEDCAHAIEAKYRGKPVGSFGVGGCFSFYATKNVTTGEGGMVLSSDASLIDRIKVLSLHGMSKDAWHRYSDKGFKHYDVVACGFKYNMMDIQAAIGIHQLEKVDKFWAKREDIWSEYQDKLADLPISLPKNPEPHIKHGYHLYTIQVNEQHCGLSRDQFLDKMTWHGIGVGVHYLSLPEHSYYKERFSWEADDYPNAKKVGRETVSLPLSPKLTNADVKDVIDAVRRTIE